eukprot:TRINITY_DN1484_c0_g1_i2.p1 TRINITY_DN1484_c0_g1~~TRINITY_DN1484_c0_g1_i2.p1  ORF type:complete len:309 (+),score=20.13 TRINITY_DN1484_c0_g1_i2:20-946(+)
MTTNNPVFSVFSVNDMQLITHIPQPTQQPVKKQRRVHVKSACVPCRQAHAACDEKRPCSRCVKRNHPELCSSKSHLEEHEDSEDYDEAPTAKRPRIESPQHPSNTMYSSSTLSNPPFPTPNLNINPSSLSSPSHFQSQLQVDFTNLSPSGSWSSKPSPPVSASPTHSNTFTQPLTSKGKRPSLSSASPIFNNAAYIESSTSVGQDGSGNDTQFEHKSHLHSSGSLIHESRALKHDANNNVQDHNMSQAARKSDLDSVLYNNSSPQNQINRDQVSFIEKIIIIQTPLDIVVLYFDSCVFYYTIFLLHNK